MRTSAMLTVIILAESFAASTAFASGSEEAAANAATANIPPMTQESKKEPNTLTPAASAPPGYRIGAGDVLQISIWKEAEASIPGVVVRPDGRISLPLVKEVDVLGLTPAEVERNLAERFSRFINAPEVTVVIKEIHSQKVYLVGAVKKAGALRLQAPMTVLQALAEAGGLTDYAKKKKIIVLRTENQRQTRLPFNYDAAIRGEQNIIVQPGDTIIVP